MTRRRGVLALAGAAAAAIAVALAGLGEARAGSIWAKAQENKVAPRGYTDDVARQVGDVLTIVVNERSLIENAMERKNDKKSDRTFKTGGSFTTNTMSKWFGKKSATFTAPTADLTSNAESKFDGQADYTANRKITDSITVTVYDVLPNGNLVVMGSRERKVESDTQVINISGIVRTSDITFANTVLSEQVAEFQMFTAMKGPETQWTNQGWFGRLFNLLSPW
jgi:flagellar L-ring protein precursor FlgH